MVREEPSQKTRGEASGTLPCWIRWSEKAPAEKGASHRTRRGQGLWGRGHAALAVRQALSGLCADPQGVSRRKQERVTQLCSSFPSCRLFENHPWSTEDRKNPCAQPRSLASPEGPSGELCLPVSPGPAGHRRREGRIKMHCEFRTRTRYSLKVMQF